MKGTAVITGASRGIGFAISKRLFEQGYDIVMISKNLETIKHAHSLLPASTFRAFDVSQTAEIKTICSEITNSAKSPVSVLVNAAGISMNSLLLRSNDEDIMNCISTNLTSSLLLTKYFSKDLIKTKGSIVNISSVIGNFKQQQALSIYAASKAGLVGFTKSIAKELAPKGVRCNAILPGFIATDMTRAFNQAELAKNIPLGRIGNVDDVAEACMFLVNSSYITGHSLVIDGGLSL